MSEDQARHTHHLGRLGDRAGARSRSVERLAGLAFVVVATVGAVLAFTGGGPGAPVRELVGRHDERIDNTSVARTADACDPAGDIGTCFTDGEPFVRVPLDDYWHLFLLARDELLLRSDHGPDAIKLLDMARKNWGDTSLGNPKPDVMYAEVEVPGFILVLEAGDGEYEYHTGVDRVVFVEDGVYDGQPMMRRGKLTCTPQAPGSAPPSPAT